MLARMNRSIDGAVEVSNEDSGEGNFKPIIVSLSPILNGSHKLDFQLESLPANPVSDWILS